MGPELKPQFRTDVFPLRLSALPALSGPKRSVSILIIASIPCETGINDRTIDRSRYYVERRTSQRKERKELRKEKEEEEKTYVC